MDLSTVPTRKAGSFRDPSGYVFDTGDAILRSINASALHGFDELWNRGVFQELINSGLLIDTERIGLSSYLAGQMTGPRGEVPERLVRHPRVPFYSYPYEWTFSQLKEAALGHLDLQVAALDRGAVLSDATPYNMQPVNGRMQFVDVLSLRPYRDGEMWAGYNQFCRLFLLPLLLEAWNGVAFQPLLRGSLDGIKLGDAARTLPFFKRILTLNGLMHVTLHASQEHSHARRRTAHIGQPPSMPSKRYRALLTELRNWIAGLESRRQRSYWNDYAADNSYDATSRDVKHAFVARFISEHSIRTVWDIGGNSGDYSATALDAGASHAVVLDSDLDALELAYARSREKYPGLLPLVMDCGDPSPGLGWNQAERASLRERAQADAVLALAISHHLAIGRNIPPRALLEWLVSLAPRGVVEFVPKEDPMVKRMLALRDDVFHDYDEEHFLEYLRELSEITRIERLDTSGRLIIAYRRLA